MGTILKSRFSFTTLEGIRDAYRVAFSEDDDRVRAACGDRALFRLSCVRNVLVHRGGVVDAEFARKMRNEPIISGVSEGQPLPIDGEVARSLIDPAVECG